MADARLDRAEDYDENAAPEEVDDQDLVMGLRRLREISYLQDKYDQERKALLRSVIPRLRRPAAMLDPITGNPTFAVVSQARPIKVDAGQLLDALREHYGDDAKAEQVWADCLKPREVDSTQEGLFLAACARGDVPLEVVAKVAREKPSSATVRFTIPERHRQ